MPKNNLSIKIKHYLILFLLIQKSYHADFQSFCNYFIAAAGTGFYIHLDRQLASKIYSLKILTNSNKEDDKDKLIKNYNEAIKKLLIPYPKNFKFYDNSEVQRELDPEKQCELVRLLAAREYANKIIFEDNDKKSFLPIAVAVIALLAGFEINALTKLVQD